jgi:hypothetical protein
MYPQSNGGETSMSFYNNNIASGNTTRWVAGHNVTVGIGNFGFWNSSFNAPVMALTSTGNVGIGTTAPAHKLDVVGTIDATTYTGSNIMVSGSIGSLGSIDAGSQFLGQPNDNATAPSFSWTGDTNTGMYRPLADTLGFVTNGVERMRVTTGGNVGIGTTSPGEALEIRGNLRVGNSTSGNYISFYGTNGDIPGGWNHTYIGERIYNPTEQSELLLFKGNDSTTGGGADRIRLLAAEHKIDIYTSTLNGTFEGVGTSGTNIMTINSSGTLVTGSITKTVYNSGEVIQSKCYSSAIGTSFTTSISGAYPVVVSTLSFTPLSSSSFIMVSVDCTYSVPGSGPDTFQSGITIAGTTVITKSQTWYASGTDISTTMRNNNNSLFPLMGIAPNTSTTAKTIQVLAGRGTSDDTMTLSNINIEIREIKQ